MKEAERQAVEQHIAFEIGDAVRDRVATCITQGDGHAGTRRTGIAGDQQYLGLDAAGRPQRDGQASDFARAQAQLVAGSGGPQVESGQRCQLGFNFHWRPGGQPAQQHAAIVPGCFGAQAVANNEAATR